MTMNDIMNALNDMKAETGIDYTHADAQTQEEQAALYMEFARQRQQVHQPKPKTAEQMADEHDQHVVDVYNRHRRNGWQQTKEYEGIAWDRLMTVQEAADALGVNRQRVHQLIASGKLLASKVGSTWIVDAESVNLRLSSTI